MSTTVKSPGASPRRRRFAGTLVRVGVAATVMGALLGQTGVAPLARIVEGAAPAPLAAALVLFAAGQVASAWRWWRIAQHAGFAVSFRSCLGIYWIGMFVGVATPSTIGADGTRTLLLGRARPGRRVALSTVLFDRAIGLLTLLWIALAAFTLDRTALLPVELRVGVATLAAVGSAGLLGAPLLVRALPTGSRLAAASARHLLPFVKSRRLLLTTAASSLCVHGLHIAAQKALAEALGLDLPWTFVALYHPLVALAGAAPITIGGFGVREAAYALLLGAAGVPLDDAVALGLLWWALGATVGLSGGLVWLAGRFQRRAQA